MKIYMQLAGYRSDGVSSDCINRIGDTKVVETTTTKDIIAEANEMLVAAREQQVWRPVILLATGDWRWAPDARPGWYMGGRWLFSFNPERDAEQLATTMTKQQVIEAAQFACSKEGHKRGSGAMRELKEAVAALEGTPERYRVYYNRGTGLAEVMPYLPDEVFPLGEVTYQNQAPGPHYDVVGDFATREEAEADKKRLELPLYE